MNKKRIRIAKEICTGNPDVIVRWMESRDPRDYLILLAWLLLGSSIYGMAVGIWRAPLHAFYVGLKFPLLILLTSLGNSLINGMVAQLLGARMSFVQSFKLVFISFTSASIILLSLSPVLFFLVYSMPPMESAGAAFAHKIILLSDVFVIAFAGIVSNIHLLRVLYRVTDHKMHSRRILVSWLTVNLVLGGQLSWIMRPFVGTPSFPVQFFRPDALNSNFFEGLFRVVTSILGM